MCDWNRQLKSQSTLHSTSLVLRSSEHRILCFWRSKEHSIALGYIMCIIIAINKCYYGKAIVSTLWHPGGIYSFIIWVLIEGARKSPTATQGGIIIKRAFSISSKRFLLYIISQATHSQIGTDRNCRGTGYNMNYNQKHWRYIVGTLQIRVCCVYLISNDWHHKNHYSICHKSGTVHHPRVAPGRSHPYPCSHTVLTTHICTVSTVFRERTE